MPLFFRIGLAAFALASASIYAVADMSPGTHDMPHVMSPAIDSPALAALPTSPGQEAFGAIQEILGILEADPHTDWSKVNIAALREHLIDMDELTLHARAEERKLASGVEIAVTGEGRTLEAIRRMVPAQARQLNGMHGWSAVSAPLPDGTKLVVTTTDRREVVKLQALGFIGLMAQGGHHQAHHLMIAKGEMIE